MLNLNNTQQLNLNLKPTLNFKNCSRVCAYNCRAEHSTEQFWYFPSYPPDNRHCSDDVYWRRGGVSAGTFDHVSADWRRDDRRPKDTQPTAS